MEISETFTNSAEQGIISQKDFFDHKVASTENIGNYYVVDNNDFVYNPRISTTAPVGPINRNRLDHAGVMSPLYTVFRAKDINQLFLEWYFKSSCWHLFMYFNGDSGARSDRFSIKDSVFFSMPIFVPSKEEQFKIGRFFDQLNETITLQQRKLNSLQKLKKGLLQKMFPKNGENIPEIRFPEFSDAWKQRKFGDVLVSIQTGTNKLGSDRNSGQPLLKMGNLQSGYFDLSKLEFLENKAEPENIVKQGDFFFNTRNTLELVGKGATWFGESNKYAFNSNIARFTLKDINTGFFNYLYNTNYVKKQIRARAMGTTSVAAIYPRSLKSVDIVIPNMEEQIKLSNLFMNLDSTITLQQRKLNSHQKLKKGLFQKMFPKNGENIPEIRFPEFSDAWKQRKVKELCSISTGKSNTQDKIDDGEYPFYVRSPIVEHSNKYLFDEEAVLTVGDGVGTGKVFHYVNGKYDLHQRCYRMFAFKEDLRAKYFYYIFSKLFYKRVMAMTAKTSVDSVRLEMISEMSIPVPSVAEQLKIESLLSELDNFITLQQRWLFYTHKHS